MDIKETNPLHFNKWINHYLRNASDVHAFYAHAPLTEDVFVQRVHELDSHVRMQAPREKLADVITSFHTPEMLLPEIQQNIERLRDEKSLVVIGGHQACLLTGPMYTIYKAMTIIRLAQREETRLGRPVIPVFWIAGEDHDWDEVNHIWIQGTAQKPSKLGFASTSNRKPISEVMCNPQQMNYWFDELSRVLPDSIHKKEWVRILKEFTSTPITWTRFFARVMMHFFGKYGLLLVDAADPDLRELEKPFWEVLLTRNREIQSLVRQKSSEMIDLGYPSIVPDKDNFAHLFLCRKGNRYPLYFDGKTWTAPGVDGEWDTSEMLNLANTSPEKLSNNVLTRPLMQEYIFPTLSFVGGAAEVQYWGILKDVFDICGLQMPVVYPRMQITLVPHSIEKRMQGFGMTLQDVTTRFDEMKEKWLEKKHPVNVDALFLQAKQEIEATHQRLLEQINAEVEINLVESGQVNKNKLMEHLTYLERYAEHALHKKYDVEMRQWDEMRNTLYPRNKPQERIYNVVEYWNAYGVEWIDALVRIPLVTRANASYSISI